MEPQGVDVFAEGLSSFKNQEIISTNVEPPTAAVESASLNIDKPNVGKKVTITEPEVQTVNEDNHLIEELEHFYYENQTILLASLAIGVGYYFHRQNKK